MKAKKLALTLEEILEEEGLAVKEMDPGESKRIPIGWFQARKIRRVEIGIAETRFNRKHETPEKGFKLLAVEDVHEKLTAIILYCDRK